MDRVNLIMDAKGIILETITPGEGTKTLRIFPTRKTDYQKGETLSWGMDLTKVWGPAWYRNPEDNFPISRLGPLVIGVCSDGDVIDRDHQTNKRGSKLGRCRHAGRLHKARGVSLPPLPADSPSRP